MMVVLWKDEEHDEKENKNISNNIAEEISLFYLFFIINVST